MVLPLRRLFLFTTALVAIVLAALLLAASYRAAPIDAAMPSDQASVAPGVSAAWSRDEVVASSSSWPADQGLPPQVPLSDGAAAAVVLAGSIPLGFGDTVTGTLGTPGQVISHTVEAVAGDRVLVRMRGTSGAVDPEIAVIGPTGSPNPGCTGYSYSYWSSAGEVLCAIPLSGVQTIVVGDHGANATGAFSLHVQRTNNPGNAPAFSYGSAVTGTVSFAEADAYTVSAMAGDRLLVRMRGTSGGLDGEVRVYGPDGVLGSQCTGYAYSYWSSPAEVLCSITGPGRQTILATDFGGDEEGPYSIFVQRTNNPGNAGSISFGAATTGTVFFAQLGTYTVSAAPGDLVLVRGRGTSGSVDGEVRVYGPDGSLLPGCAAYSYSYWTSPAEVLCAIATSGAQTMVVGDYGGDEAGGYSLYVQRPNDPGNAVPLSYGSTVTGSVAFAEMATFAVEDTGGYPVEVVMRGLTGGLDPEVRVYGPDGALGSGCSAYAYSYWSGPAQATCPGANSRTILTGDYGGDETGTYTVTVRTLGPEIAAITPSKGGNAGLVTMQINGRSFGASAVVKLARVGQTDVVGTGTTVTGTNQIATRFDLRGVAAGAWDVVVQLAATELRVTGGFSVVDGGTGSIVLDVQGPDRVRAGRQATFKILVRNVGLVDVANVIVLASIRPTQASDGAGAVCASQTGMPVAEASAVIPVVGAGGVSEVPLGGTLPSGCYDVVVLAKGDKTLDDITDALLDDLLSEDQATKRKACQEVEEWLQKLQNQEMWDLLVGLYGELKVKKFKSDLEGFKQDYCSGGDNLPAVRGAGGLAPRTLAAVGTEAEASAPVCALTSWDPNDKVGVSGTGDGHQVPGSQALPYTIYFENLAAATAAAQEVVITDQLDVAKVDLSSFSLGAIGFGDKWVTPALGMSQFTSEVDLRPAKALIVRIDARLDVVSGVVTWRFTSIDPATGLPPADPLAGFLPPNSSPPQGEGRVSFTVAVKPELATGSELRNSATIVFDANAPVSTPTWLNTVDSDRPASQVLSLALTQASPYFPVSWQGSDVGSGIASYTVFVSEDGGTYHPWLVGTSATAAVFRGLPGRNYRFYSQARDHAGNYEEAATTADAATATPPSYYLYLPAINARDPSWSPGWR